MMNDFSVDMNEYLPLRDVVFNTLRKAILKGELKPGERLMEIALAERLGVSRTPVREAMRKLELEGLVVMVPRRGAQVANITEKDLNDVLEVRITLENMAIEKACANMTDADIRKLEQAGLVQVLTEQGSHGNEKRCRAAVDKILVDIRDSEKDSGKNTYTAEVKIGYYSDYQVFPTCGLATVREVIGQMDDPRYFDFPKRVDAGILWFTRGYVEYRIPNELPAGMKMDRLALSVELSSEAPGVNNNWPSDISFFLNDVRLGSWMSPGDFGDVHGIFTPDWWMASLNQYGLLKRIEISDRGTFVDGLKISDVTMEQLNLDYKSPIRFRFQVEDDAENVGGLTLFGKGFGNYNQDMEVQISYSPAVRSR